MTVLSQQDNVPDGAAFDEFFESLGKKAEHLNTNKQNDKDQNPAANSGIAPQADASVKKGESGEDEDEQKVVDEIESLCMNCHENVRQKSGFVSNSGS